MSVDENVFAQIVNEIKTVIEEEGRDVESVNMAGSFSAPTEIRDFCERMIDTELAHMWLSNESLPCDSKKTDDAKTDLAFVLDLEDIVALVTSIHNRSQDAVHVYLGKRDLEVNTSIEIKKNVLAMNARKNAWLAKQTSNEDDVWDAQDQGSVRWLLPHCAGGTMLNHISVSTHLHEAYVNDRRLVAACQRDFYPVHQVIVTSQAKTAATRIRGLKPGSFDRSQEVDMGSFPVSRFVLTAFYCDQGWIYGEDREYIDHDKKGRGPSFADVNHSFVQLLETTKKWPDSVSMSLEEFCADFAASAFTKKGEGIRVTTSDMQLFQVLTEEQYKFRISMVQE